LRQLFEKRIGNTHLFQLLSDAYEHSRRTVTDEDYDRILWSVLETAFGSPLRGAKPLVVVVDGMDEVAGGEAPLLQKLQEVTSKATGLKLIVFGSQAAPARPDQANIPVTPDLILDDIAAVVRNIFENHKALITMSEVEQEILVDRITQAANGSFLWAKIAARQARQEETTEALQKSVNTLVAAKLTINDLVARCLQAPDLTENAKLILVWLATAERPLSQPELSALLSIQADKATTVAQNIDILHLLKPVNSLVCLEDGYIYLRHTQIRSAIVDVFSKGKLVPHLKDRHADLVRRLLAYVRLSVAEDREPSLTPLDLFEAGDILRKHVLLDFALRYWMVHLRKTAVFVNDGEKAAAKEFGKVFPATTTFFLLQQTFWENKDAPLLLSWYTTVVHLCRDIFTPNHIATFQTTIMLALFYRQISHVSESSQTIYEALILSRKLLSEHHIITMQVASIFLEVTASSVTNSKTETMIKREEVMLLLIDCYKSHYGATSEIVISTLTQLAEHYQFIKEERKAREIYLSLRSTTIQQYGADSQEVREINANLHVHLKSHKTTKDEDNEIDAGLLLLDVSEEDELKETVKYDFIALLQRAEKYVTEGNLALAERTYVEIWQHAASECRMHYSAEWEERKIKAVLTYTKFLKSQKREYEATSLLTTTWQEYEQQSSFSESTISHLTEVAEVMKTVGLSAVAISVFKRCAQYYESTSRVHTSSYKSIQQNIQSTSKEVMKVVSSSSSSSSSFTSETVLEEMVYEASTSITTIDETSITTVSTLYNRYISQHRWQDATRLVKRVLHGIWGALFAPSLQDVTLPSKHVDHCIELAERLSQCYHSRRRLAKEEDILVRIYRAVRSDRKVGDKLLDRVTTALVRFFERTSQTEKVIHLRQEMLSDYIKHYGLHHEIVVQNLWVLAELTRPRPIFVDYYRQIISAINKESDISKQEAIEPLIIVATELWSQGRYSDAVQYYKIIFNTFLQQPKVSVKFEQQEFVKTFFSRYTHCLRTLQSEFTAIHKITVEYQSKVKVTFGATASITIQATLTLAKLCQESKRYEIEAIHLYEELLKLKSEEIDYQEITATLDSIYEEQTAIVTSTESKSVSSSQVERAVSVLKRRIKSVRQTHGWAHEESLSKMQEMVSFYSKREETESVVQELKEATVQILSTETSSTRLVAAATAIASSYIVSRQTTKATELSQEIYRQIIMKDTTNIKTVQFDLSSKERQSLVFLAQLEYSLRQNSSVTLNEIFSSLTTEYVYFEEFRNLTKQSKNITLYSVSATAARLYVFLLSKERHSTANRVFEEFTNYFLATEAKRVKLTEVAQVRIFALTLLDYFSIHESNNFVRSVGIACEKRVQSLITEKKYEEACDLALAAFKYISAHESYRTAAVVKFVFQLGMTVSGRQISKSIDGAVRKKMLGVSATIIQDVLSVLKDLKINLAQLNISHLNNLIGLLGEQHDYQTLAWLLTLLWNSREAQRSWQSSITFALGRRFILARYLVGDTAAAVRLAEDTVYNCRRVHGHRHKITLDMSILLSQLYSSVAQRYQSQKGGQDMAHRYYKKSAAVHENILRAFTDPTYAELDGGDMSLCLDESTSSIDLAAAGASAQSGLSEGEHVRQHLQLFKLAIERFGDWPKDYSEYERLNSDVFREFKEDLQGIEGVEKWNLKNFGSGKAESNADLLDPDFDNWEILETSHVSNGAEEEEEL
jgi:hypothetical protein